MSNRHKIISVYHYHIIVNQKDYQGLLPFIKDQKSLIEKQLEDSITPSLESNESNTNKENSSKNEQNNKDNDTLYTIKEFAAYFKINELTARSWVKNGKISHIRIGRRIRIRRSEILALEKKKGA